MSASPLDRIPAWDRFPFLDPVDRARELARRSGESDSRAAEVKYLKMMLAHYSEPDHFDARHVLDIEGRLEELESEAN